MGLRSDIEEIEIDVSPPSFENEDSNQSDPGSTSGTRRSARFEDFTIFKVWKIIILRFRFVFRKPKPKEDSSTNTRLNKRLIQKEKDSFLDGFDQRSSRREKKKNQNINYRESGKGKSKFWI